MKVIRLILNRKNTLIVLVLFNLLCKNYILAQPGVVDCAGANFSAPTSAAQSASQTCNATFAGAPNYKLQSTYVPSVLDPLITLKIVVHVFTPFPQIVYNTNYGNLPWNDGPSPYNGLPGLQNLFDRLQNNHERYSLSRSANYSGPGYNPGYIYDSKLRYEVVAYYFYYSTALYNGASANALNYIDNTYPDRLKEGLPIIFTRNDQVKASIFSTLNSGVVPYVSANHVAGLNQGSLDFNNRYSDHNLRHEIAHVSGLLHTYYGGYGRPEDTGYYGWSCVTNTCVPLTGGLPSCCPETNLTGNSELNCNNPDYLTDVFPANNPACPAQCPPTHTAATPNPPISTCGSCYERNEDQMGSNNLMSSNSVNANANLPYDYGWMSPLQMGRRIRSMHIANGNILRSYAKDAVSLHSNTWNITSNEIWDFDIQMYKDIVVKAGNTLTIKCKVAMAADGRIIVERGAKLIIDGGIVTGWCKKAPVGTAFNMPLWSGIHVHGLPNQNQNINTSTGLCPNQGIVEVINSATVSNAVRGIVTSAYNTFSGLWINNTSGGIVIAKDSYFINNMYDVVLYKNLIGQERSTLTNCKFYTLGLIGNYANNTIIAPKEHVKLYENIGLKIYGCTFLYNAGNIYSQNSRGIGVYATNSHFTIDKNCTSANCSTSVSSSFLNLKIGTYIDNFNPLYTGLIKNSVYTHNKEGAIVENCNYLKFYNNKITMTGNAIGMYLYKSKYYSVKSNTITGQQQQGGGVIAYDSKDGLHELYGNTIRGLNVGVLAVDNNGGLNTDTEGLKMTCNVFNSGLSNLYDIALTPSLSPMPVVMKEQSPQFPSNALHLVKNLYGAVYGSATDNKWYVDASSTQNIFHASTPAGVDNPKSPNIQASQQVQVIPLPINFNHNQDCPAITSSGGGYGISNTQLLNNMNEYITSLRGTEGGKYEIQATVVSKINLFLLDSLPTSKDSVIALLNNNQGGMGDADIQEVFAYMHSGDYSAAGTKANALNSGRNDWKNLLLKIIEIKQDSMDVYSLMTNSANRTFVENYANTEGKDGQACAQALLRLVFDTEHEYPATYPPTQGLRPAEPEQLTAIEEGLVNNPDITIYPNPAKNGLTIANTKAAGLNVKIEIKDLLGKLIYTNFIDNETSHYITFSDLANGVYILTLSKNDKVIVYRNKVIKQD